MLLDPLNSAGVTLKNTYLSRNDPGSDRLFSLLNLLLIVAILFAFQTLMDCGFINFDDEIYITKNKYVQEGLTKDGLAWAFTVDERSANWHPLTWLSHMLDCQLFGLRAGLHHFMSLLLHIINSSLLFIVLRKMTRATWRSFFVAALFALHPLHVESVAWASERKDVLSTLFALGTIYFYIKYVARKNLWIYLLALSLFVLGLMAKPMLVTLPFLLILVDYWPLDRLWSEEIIKTSNAGSKKPYYTWLMLEKIPFFVLATGSCIITYLGQKAGGAVESLSVLSLNIRLTNALVSYVLYIKKMLWPFDLAIFYPHPGMSPAWQIILAGIILILISGVFIFYWRSKPYLLFGWCWYLGVLFPVIGLVQVGNQALADRYTYISLIGLFIIISWGLRDFFKSLSHGYVFLFPGVLVLVFCMILTRSQVGYWYNNITLYEHAISVSKDNYLAHHNLGLALFKQKRVNAAIFHFKEAIKIKSDYGYAFNNLGATLAFLKRYKEAIPYFKKAILMNYDLVKANHNLELCLKQWKRKNNTTENINLN